MTHVPVQEADPGPGDGLLLAHQETAGVARMLLGSVLTMLPVLTYGAMQAGQGRGGHCELVSCHDVQAYLTIGLPQLLEPNMTGITIDLNKMSWISETTRF